MDVCTRVRSPGSDGSMTEPGSRNPGSKRRRMTSCPAPITIWRPSASTKRRDTPQSSSGSMPASRPNPCGGAPIRTTKGCASARQIGRSVGAGWFGSTTKSQPPALSYAGLLFAIARRSVRPVLPEVRIAPEKLEGQARKINCVGIRRGIVHAPV